MKTLIFFHVEVLFLFLSVAVNLNYNLIFVPVWNSPSQHLMIFTIYSVTLNSDRKTRLSCSNQRILLVVVTMQRQQTSHCQGTLSLLHLIAMTSSNEENQDEPETINLTVLGQWFIRFFFIQMIILKIYCCNVSWNVSICITKLENKKLSVSLHCRI